MKFFFQYIIVTCIYFLSINISAQGLKFKGNEFPINERTSYNVFNEKPPIFSGKLHISFDISLLDPSQLGYIIRIKNKETKTTFNLSYDNYGSSTLFKFNEEGKSSLITAELNKKELQACHWFNISIIFDLKKDSLFLKLNNQQFTVGNLKLFEKWSPDIYFGKSDHVIDVPSFAIKQLTVSDEKYTYQFPLRENQGEKVYNTDKKAVGYVNNPLWFINDAYYWSYKEMFRSKSVAGYNFDPIEENIYIFNKDSLTTYNVRTGNIQAEAFTNKCPVDIFLGTNFLDSEAKKLYVYEVYNEKLETPSVAILDLQSKQWSIASFAKIQMQLHHHCANFDPITKRYTIFGGFGNMRYGKDLYSYNYNTNSWDIQELNGDKITPRYFSSMGHQKSSNSLYVFGGMGNESGEQIVGRRYFYDLHKIDLNNKEVTKSWEIPWDKENIVPTRSMVIEDDSSFYTLCYPEHFSNSFLKLYHFSLTNGIYKILGDSIPIHSDKIKTNANLYYAPRLYNLYTIVQEFEDNDIASSIKIYSLAFPPVSCEELTSYKEASDHNTLSVIGILGLVLATTISFFIIKQKKNKIKKGKTGYDQPKDNVILSTKKPDLQLVKASPKANGIYLFGEFMVRSQQNKDITYMFSTKLKQAFLTILQYSPKDGISSLRLSELLWPDKPEDKVKNSRGVTINHLRKILKELNGIELIYEKSLFKIVCSNPCYCDYLRCLDIIDSDNVEQNTAELIEIVTRGKFLKSIDLPEFDSFKENLEQKLEPVLLLEAERNFKSEAYKTTIALCEAIFSIDPINDDAIYYTILALTRLKMNNEAKKQYLFFTSEYRKMMGLEYPTSLSDILNTRR